MVEKVPAGGDAGLVCSGCGKKCKAKTERGANRAGWNRLFIIAVVEGQSGGGPWFCPKRLHDHRYGTA